MRKLISGLITILLAASGLFVWLRSDKSVLAGTNVMGMDDSSGWISANSGNPEVLDTLEAAHVRMLQVALPWNEVEKSAGIYTWAFNSDTGYFDFPILFKRLHTHNIEPLVILSGGPIYLNHLYPQQPVFRDQLLANWENYVQEAVRQFGDVVDYWQIGRVLNDPVEWGSVVFPGVEAAIAGPDPALYGEMLAIAYNTIKGVQASDTVLLGELEFTADCTLHPVNYLQALADLEVWGGFDVINLSLPELDAAPEKAAVDVCGIQPVQVNGIPGPDAVRAVSNLAELAGEKPVWLHDLRFSNAFLAKKAEKRATIAEVIASDYLARSTGLYLSFGEAERVFWAFDPLENIPGIVAMQAFANLSQSLSSHFERNSMPSDGEAYALEFRSNGNLSTLAWYSRGGDAPSPMVIPGFSGYDLTAYSVDSPSMKEKDGIILSADASGSAALLVSERPVLIRGEASSIRQAVTATVEEQIKQAGDGLEKKLHDLIEAQKPKITAKTDEMIAEGKASLMKSMREVLKEWIQETLGNTPL